MNLNFVPSLQHLTYVKISIILCDNHEIKASIKENERIRTYGTLCTIQRGNYFSMLESLNGHIPSNTGHLEPRHDVHDIHLLEQVLDRMRAMISPLNLGTSFDNKILSFIPHIILEIKKWEEDHSKICPAQFDAQVYFCWKSVGTVDRERTAENLLNHANLSVKGRFDLACMYCMQDRLPSLWSSFSDSYKGQLTSKCHRGSLLNYWTTRLEGLSSVFPDASYIVNVSAMQYFYAKYSGEDRKQALLNDVLSEHERNIDLVRFCASKLCQNGQDLSSSQCYNILRCFLNWPLQSLFLEMSECLIVKLDLIRMNDLLHDILGMIVEPQYEDFDYRNLLEEIWEKIPSRCKDSLMKTPYFQPIRTLLQQISAKSVIH